jgi:hypothetical protein
MSLATETTFVTSLYSTILLRTPTSATDLWPLPPMRRKSPPVC